MNCLYLQGGDWEAALERFNIQKEQAAGVGVGIPLSPTGLSRQGTRKMGVLGRTNTINPLTRQATLNVSSAGSKRAQAVEGLKQQVEELKARLQVRSPAPLSPSHPIPSPLCPPASPPLPSPPLPSLSWCEAEE